MKIAFIGLGIMGSRMANHLLKDQADLTVFNRSIGPTIPLKESGAKVATTITEAVKDADFVFSMLSTPEVVHQVFFGDQGALAHMKKKAMWIDCTTVNPTFSLESANQAKAAGVRFIDAPVAGTKPHAQHAELVFFVGGDQHEVNEVLPLLEMMGKKVMHIGSTGKGSSFKMLVNIMLAQSMVIFSEAILLGQKMGMDKNFLLDVMPNLVVAAPFTKMKATMIKNGAYEVQFPLEWMHKDLHLAALTAYEFDQPLYLANLTKEVFAEAKRAGMGRLDFAAIHQYLEHQAQKASS